MRSQRHHRSQRASLPSIPPRKIVGAKITKWTEGVAPADTPITIANLTNVGWDTAGQLPIRYFKALSPAITAGIGTPKNGIFIADGDAGLDIYGYTGDCSAFPVGTCVTVVGVPSVFNGLIEFTANKHRGDGDGRYHRESGGYGGIRWYHWS
jgi:hypothetical protein